MMEQMAVGEVVYKRDEEQPLVDALLQKRETMRQSLQELDMERARVQEELNRQLEELQARRQPLEAGLQHVEALLRLEGWTGEPEGTIAAPGDQRLSSPDEAYELLKKAGEPMHYKDIVSRLLEQGIPLPGKNPQATLLAHLARDARFKRAAQRGVYGLSEWKFKTAKPRRRKQRRARKQASGEAKR